MTLAWIFPGQGSQAVGMGLDLVDLPEAQEKLQVAQEILGWSLPDLSAETLQRTLYTQPALFLVSSLLTDALQALGKSPDCVAGHSLGELSALYAAGVLDWATGLTLVSKRAALMDAGAPGGMMAVVGFDRAKLADLCASTPDVYMANDNSPDQVVITGSMDRLQEVVALLKPKRGIPLAVSGAFHSPFMAAASDQFNQILDGVLFQPARIPVYSNVTGEASQDPDLLKQNLRLQMVSPVQWRSTVVNMASQGVTQCWEIGPGNVLTGLVKRTASSVDRLAINNLASFPG